MKVIRCDIILNYALEKYFLSSKRDAILKLFFLKQGIDVYMIE